MGRVTTTISPDPSIKDLLARRGFIYAGQGDESVLIRPQIVNFQMSMKYHELLDRYSFRKILRLITARKEPVHNKELIPICSEPLLGQFKEFLVNSSIVEIDEDNSWSLKVKVDSFGYTLEWYISELLVKRLNAISSWNIKIEGLLAGGDFDILAFIDTILLCVESKAKRPEDIDDSEVRNFLQRSQDLAPELSVMLVDTDSELDALIDKFNTILLSARRISMGITDRNWQPKKPFIARVAGYSNICFGLQRIFLTHSQPSIFRNLQDCLRYYHTYIKFASFWGGPRFNYITEEIIEDNR
ncbi:hypothetical protein ES703_67205 [subsurface metagenome]